MFNKNKVKTEDLVQVIESLKKEIQELKSKHSLEIKLLRQQLAASAAGLTPTPESILNGLPYSEILKENVEAFIQSVPNLLILDVRSDQGWDQGHIPEAKHIPAAQVFQRLDEIPDRTQPILTFCANGNTAVTVCQTLAREGYRHVFNALGGMAGYPGKVIRPAIESTDINQVKGTDRQLIAKVLDILDREVRPGLKRDGGDLLLLGVEDGIVTIKMTGACVGCGALKRTVDLGIKNHLQKFIPQIKDVQDQSHS